MNSEKIDLNELIEILELSKPNKDENTLKSSDLVEMLEILDPIEYFRSYKLTNSKNRVEPLKAVVLDNDETTGSYGIVFAFVHTYILGPVISHKHMAYIFRQLAFWMFKNNVFRPGIYILLKKLLELKKGGQIDAIIMYTNQMDSSRATIYVDYNPIYPDFLKSPARTIAYMMECLVGEKIFDHILTREPNQPPNSTGCCPKSFERILSLYPDHPNDITNIVFVDDLACPQFITADSIEKKSSDSWYCISPYIKKLSITDLQDCVNFCVEDKIDQKYILLNVYEYIKDSRAPSKSSCEDCCSSLIELCSFLDIKFVFSFYLWVDNLSDDDLNKKNSIVVYG